MITLANLHEHTEMQVFEQAKKHLLAQNQQSIGDDLSCCYQTKGGLKCAAGCFISSKEYDAKMEGKSWSGLVDRSIAPRCHAELISQLQIIHDHYEPHEWPKQLDDIEEVFFKNKIEKENA